MVRRIAVAMAALGLLAGGLWIVARKDAREARVERAQSRLPAFDDRMVTAIAVEARSGSFRVVRQASGWRIVTPVEDVASARAVELLLAAARATPVIQTLDAPDAMSSYGLEPPVARLKLEGANVPPLELGDVTPAGDGLFAKVPGRHGVLILKLPDGQALVAPEVGRLRDTSFVDLARSEIASVEIASGGVRLARSGDVWWLESPRRFPASPAQVDRLLDAVYKARVIGSDDAGSPSDPRFGLGDTAVRLTLHAGVASRQVVLGGSAGKGRVFATCEGRKTVLLVETPAPSTLPLDVDALRDRRLTNINRYTVTRMAYASSAKRFAATRQDEATWTTESGAAIGSGAVYALLVQLLEAPAPAWSDGTPTGSPVATLEYATASGDTGRVEFFGDRAVWSVLPGVVYRLGAAPPPVP